MNRWKLLALLCAIVVALAACGGDVEGADTSSPTNAVTATSESTEADAGEVDEVAPSDEPPESVAAPDPVDLGPLASMLVYVPDSSANRGLLFLSDFEGALDAGGLEWPADDDEDAFLDVLGALSFSGDPPIFLLSGAFGNGRIDVDEWRTQFGFSIIETQRTVFTGEAPGELSIFDTVRSADEIEAALRSDPVWSPELNEIGDRDGGYFVWGEDPMASRREHLASGTRSLGRGGALAVLDDGTAIRSVDPAVVEQSLAATAGEFRSLADDESYVAVADALDEAGVYSALLTSETFGLDPFFFVPLGSDAETAEEIVEELAAMPTVPPYLALGIGNKVDLDADPQGVLLLVFAATSPERALETVVVMEEIIATGTSLDLERPWSELLTITSTSTDGAIAIIEFQTVNPGLGVRSFYARDSLFASS